MPLLSADRLLLQSFREGEEASIRRVYLFYYPRLARALARGFSFHAQGQTARFGGEKSPFEAEAILQEVFGRAFLPSARLAYSGLQPYENYLLVILRNVVIDGLRRKQGDALSRWPMEASEADEAGLVAEEATPQDQAEETELAMLVDRFRLALPERLSRLFETRFRENLPQTQAAKLLGMSRSQVRTAEIKLRQDLLAFLKENGYLQGCPNPS